MGLTGPSPLFVVLARAMLAGPLYFLAGLNVSALRVLPLPSIRQLGALCGLIVLVVRSRSALTQASVVLPVTRLRQHGSSRASSVVEVSSACVVCGAGLIGFERSYCRDCRLELSVLWRVSVRRKVGLPR
jgi:hypothetical protein